MSAEPEYDSPVGPTAEPAHQDDRCHVPLTNNGVTVARCEQARGHNDRHRCPGFNWHNHRVLQVASPAEVAAGRPFTLAVAEPAKSSPIDDIRAIEAASSTRPAPDQIWNGGHPPPPPAGIVEACGCEESVSLTERVELLETLFADIGAASGVGPSITPDGLVEHVRQLVANCDRSDEIASLTRALKAEREAALDAMHRAARLTLHNRMLLGLVEVLAAPPKPESSLARARSLCAEGLEIVQFVTGLGMVAARVTAEAAGAGVLRMALDALGWAAVRTY